MSSDEEMKEMVGGCCVCSDERGWDENPLVYCDGQGCNVAVHQACYGIVTVPSGPWFCRKCESQDKTTRVKCDLCPSRDGALKRTDKGGWAHVVCALYIPEVRFGNVTTMEPILISLIPTERFGRPCYICESSGRASKANAGACMQCNKPGCKQTFHVTCAQIQGLLCEEAGNMDNVKYCGYCQYHYGKLKSARNVKIIPPFRPVTSGIAPNTDSPSTSPEKSTIKPLFTSDEKMFSASGSSSTPLSRNGGTPISTTGDYIPAKKTGSSHSISPDIESKNAKILKKSSNSGGHGHSSGSKSSDSSASSKSGTSTAITPKTSQPVLAPANFSSSHSSKNSEENKEEDISDSFSRKGKSVKDIETPPKDENFTVKLERVDNPLMKGSAHSKKDFSTLQLKEVVTAALDRPMTASKYDHGSSGTSGIEAGNASGSISSTSGQSSKHQHHGHSEKPAPPDIKPHVTLTPIPMRGSGSGRSQKGESEDREEKEKDPVPMSKSKTPVSSTLSFHSTFGGSKGHTPDPPETTKAQRHSETISPKEPPLMEKSAQPPAKRARGSSRDEDRQERGRKTPTKGRGSGRRGAGNSGYSKRDPFLDENSRDEAMELENSNSSRGGRSGPGRKPGSSRPVGRPMREDPPTPTLSQLKSQMEAAAGGADSTSTLGMLPTHMFGNALNPASSMAQRMVDTLSQEMEAVAAAGAGGIADISSTPSPIVGISLPGKSISSASLNGHSASMSINASGSVPPQTLEQLLERQWEQGSQFLMEQAQHLDIAQLLSCLNQLKQDNRALEEHVQSLVQRRDQLIAINARLSIPLGNSNALGPLAPVFNTGVNGGAVQNGHGTPPLSNQTLSVHSSVPKGLQVNPSTPSPQHQQHEASRHGHREERMMYHSEMQVSRSEIVAHPASSPHGHSAHSNTRQNVAPYGYTPTLQQHQHQQQQQLQQQQHHSHSSSHHSHGRDGSR